MSEIAIIERQSRNLRALDIKKAFIPIEQPGQTSEKYTIVWKNLSYTVKNDPFTRMLAYIQGIKNLPKSKEIVKNVSGSLVRGELLAMMGPSGAGKSTLLESIVGKKVLGRKGDIICNYRGKLTMAFIPQHDDFFHTLTVKEVMLFSVKLKMATKFYEDDRNMASSLRDNDLKGLERKSNKHYESIVNGLLKQFGLEVCADNRIGVCSGGQLKRLSIAQELVVKPDILVLDEPTSGLDSTSCLQLIEYLKALTEASNPMTIVATIHQPSYRVFTLFHRLYLLAINGKCIYEGTPTNVVEHLSAFGLNCPSFYNPAEYIMEIACGDFGQKTLKELNSAQEVQFENMQNVRNTKGRDLSELTKATKFPNVDHFITLTRRALLITLRDPWLFALRLVIYTSVAVYVGLLYGDEVGQKGGCPPVFDEEFDPQQLEEIQRHTKRQVDVVMDNCGQVFFALIFLLFSSMMATCLTFPLEMKAFVKEKSNGWYGVGTYFLGKTMADIPFQIVFTALYVFITYTMTGQVMEAWRVTAYFSISVIVGLIAQSQGLLISAFTMANTTAGVYISPISGIPMLLYAGYFFKLSAMPIYHYYLMLGTYMKYSFSGLLNVLYGFRRCGVEAETTLIVARESIVEWFRDMLGVVTDEERTNSNETITGTGVTAEFVEDLVKLIVGDYVSKDGTVASMALIFFEVEKNPVLLDVAALIFWLILMRGLAYVVIRWKVNTKQ